MKELYELSDEMYDKVDGLLTQELNWLEDAINIRRNVLMAEKLERAGISALARRDIAEDIYVNFNLVGIKLPNGDGVWATLDECQMLLDTVANLPVEEALRRWQHKIAEVDVEPYTWGDAVQDTREARFVLRGQMLRGELPPGSYSDLYRATSFMYLAEV